MIIKTLFATRAATTEEYRAAIKRRIACLWAVSVLGAVTLAVTLLLMNGQIADGADAAYLQGVWCGIGSGLIVAGAMFALRTRRLLRDEAALRKAMLQEKDERNIAIDQRALSATAGIGFVLLYVGLLAFSFIDLTVFRTLCCCALGFVLVFVGAKAFYQRRM